MAGSPIRRIREVFCQLASITGSIFGVLGRFHQDPNDIKLLDYSEVYRGSMEQADLILDTSETGQWNSGPIVLLQDDTVTNEWMLPVPADKPDWMRIYIFGPLYPTWSLTFGSRTSSYKISCSR